MRGIAGKFDVLPDGNSHQRQQQRCSRYLHH
jgi:hypothetical protein